MKEEHLISISLASSHDGHCEINVIVYFYSLLHSHRQIIGLLLGSKTRFCVPCTRMCHSNVYS